MSNPKRRIQIETPNRQAVYEAIGVSSGNTIPADLSGEFPNVQLVGRNREPLPIPPVTLIVYRSRENYLKPGRRIMVTCPNCTYQVPFASLQQHYTTATCDEYAERVAACPLSMKSPASHYAGKHPKGYSVLSLLFGGFILQTYHPNGKPRREAYRGDWRHCERYSMLATQPAAFCDWIVEASGEVPDELKTPQAIAAFEAFGLSFRVLKLDEYGMLVAASQNIQYANATREYMQNRNAMDRRRDAKNAREEETKHYALSLIILKDNFPWLYE
jgi:hypothetical protein